MGTYRSGGGQRRSGVGGHRFPSGSCEQVSVRTQFLFRKKDEFVMVCSICRRSVIEIFDSCFSLAMGVPLASMNWGSVHPGQRDEGGCSHVGSVEPDESLVGIVQVVRGEDEVGADVQADSAQSPWEKKPNSPGWTKRYVPFLNELASSSSYGVCGCANGGNQNMRLQLEMLMRATRKKGQNW
jgi:hypothetical protein